MLRWRKGNLSNYRLNNFRTKQCSHSFLNYFSYKWARSKTIPWTFDIWCVFEDTVGEFQYKGESHKTPLCVTRSKMVWLQEKGIGYNMCKHLKMTIYIYPQMNPTSSSNDNEHDNVKLMTLDIFKKWIIRTWLVEYHFCKCIRIVFVCIVHWQ